MTGEVLPPEPTTEAPPLTVPAPDDPEGAPEVPETPDKPEPEE